MSSRCRLCTHEMHKDRVGWEQVCPDCRKLGFRELLDMKYDYNDERRRRIYYKIRNKVIQSIRNFLCDIFGCHYPMMTWYKDPTMEPMFKPDITQPCTFCRRTVYDKKPLKDIK